MLKYSQLAVPRRSLAWMAVLLAVSPVPTAWAVIVIEKGTGTRIRGHLVSDEPARLVIRERLPDGSLQERTIPRASVDDVIQAVSAERLQALDKRNPQAYRDYAEELAEKREDPDAEATAIRLFLIAAYLEPTKLGRSSLLGMVALARSPAEERKFRALAFLLDGAHDRSVLREPAGGSLDIMALSRDERVLLAAMLRALREGRADDARAMAGRPAMGPVLSRISRILAHDDFATLRNGDRVSPALLRRIVTLELMMAGEPAASDQTGSEVRRSGWSDLTTSALATELPQLTLATVTEFNPADCHFRDGRWVP
ncbi:MAG: hypothetical protein AB7F89_07935 [Pirellulaceae bacterium]